MKIKDINKLLVLALSYIVLVLLLWSIVEALCGNPTFWGSTFFSLTLTAGAFAEQIRIVYFAVVLCLLLHYVWLVVRLRKVRQKEAIAKRLRQQQEVLVERTPTRMAESTYLEETALEPKVCVSWLAADGSKGDTELNFEDLRCPIGWTIGRPGYSDLGLEDTGLAPKQLALCVEGESALILKHLLAGRADSVSLNGKPFQPGESRTLDARTTVKVGASRLSITVR